MKAILGVLIAIATGVITNLVSNYFARAADRNKRVVILLFILLIAFSMYLALLPPSAESIVGDYYYLWNNLDLFAVFIVLIGLLGSTYCVRPVINHFTGTLSSLANLPFQRKRRLGRLKAQPNRARVWAFIKNLPRLFFVSLAGLVISVILIVTGIQYQQYKIAQPPSEFRVLVANFDGPNPEQYRVTEHILSRLRYTLKSYPDVVVDGLNHVIIEQEGSKEAHDIGNKYRASLVIWGWYGATSNTVKLSVNFEILCPLKCKPHLKANVLGEPQAFSLSELERFTLQSDLSDQMAALSLFIVGLARYSKGKSSDAIESFTEAISQFDKYAYPEIYYYRGMAYMNINQSQLALDDFDQAISIEPNYAAAYNNRAPIYLNRGDFDRAIQEVSKAIALAPNDASYYHNRGVYHLDVHQSKLALIDLNKAVELSPDDARYHKDRGIAYYQLEDYENALTDLERAFVLFDKDREGYQDEDTSEEIARTHVYYGTIQAIFEDYDNAIKHFDLAIKLKPDYANAYLLRAGIYHQNDNFAKAKSDLLHALSIGLDPEREKEALKELDAVEKGIPMNVTYGD